VPRGISAAQLSAAEAMASQATPSPQTAPQEVAATASLSLDQAQMLQVIARDLAKLGQRIEELNTRQEQMAGENAKLDQAQMPPGDGAGSGQAEGNGSRNSTPVRNRWQERMRRPSSNLRRARTSWPATMRKPHEQIKADRETDGQVLGGWASEQKLRPKTPAPKPHPIGCPEALKDPGMIAPWWRRACRCRYFFLLDSKW